MSATARIHTMKIGAHASTTDWDTISAASEFVPIDGEVVIPGALGYAKIPRNFQSDDNTNFASIQGPQNLSLPDIPIAMTGLSAGGAGDGVATSGLAIDIDSVLDALFGASPVDSDGEGGHATVAGTGTSLILDATPSSMPAGSGVLVQGDVSLAYQAREIAANAGSTDTITMDRALTENDNTAEDQDEAAVVYAAKTWVIDPSIVEHKHYSMDVENDLGRRLIYGIMGNAQFNFPRGGYVQLMLNGQQCTSWTRGSPADPTVTFGTTGSVIKCWDMPMWIGADLFMAYDLSFDFGSQIQPRDSDGGPNGRWGYVVTQKMPKLSGKIRAGSLNAPRELTDVTADGYHALTTKDIGLQVGRSPGEAMYIRIPNARFEVLGTSIENGQVVYNFEAVATDRTVDSNGGLARVHIF